MFKFDFQVEEEEDSDLKLDVPGPSSPRRVESDRDETYGDKKAYHVTLDDLLDSLPETISYSPLYIPGLIHPILRRDLYDARFQLTQKDTTDIVGDEEYVDSTTDLVPGLYEGGLKTWEGGIDLIQVLSLTNETKDWVSGSKVIEVGCGTAIPSAYLLSTLFGGKSTPTQKTIFHLQDFNRPVLELVTLPNLILALLPHIPPEEIQSDDPEENGVEEVVVDTTKPGLLTISTKVKQAFKDLLHANQIELKFSYGHWKGLSEDVEGYDLVLTSETIYEEKSVNDLLALLKACYKQSHVKKVDVGLEEGISELAIDSWRSVPLRDGTESVILVAAKVLYFGVGGGVQDFLKKVQAEGGWHESVKEWVTGVGRKVFRVGF